MGTWIKETDTAIYLMENNSYLERLPKVPRPNGEAQVDISRMKQWFARPDAPNGMVVAVGIKAAEPQPKQGNAKPQVRFIPASEANYRPRRAGFDIDTIVIHNTVGSLNATIATFQNPNTQVSAHYVVARSGQIVQMVSDLNCSYHAGDRDTNDRSIGIEHEANVGDAPGFTAAQQSASVALIKFLIGAYKVPRSRILAHRTITETECPGIIFPDTASFNRWVQANF